MWNSTELEFQVATMNEYTANENYFLRPFRDKSIGIFLISDTVSFNLLIVNSFKIFKVFNVRHFKRLKMFQQF